MPEFTVEPPREPCCYVKNDLLDLDEISRDTFAGGLYKPQGWCSPFRSESGAAGALGVAEACANYGALDLAAISHLCKLRVEDLRNTIAYLHSLDSALTFINDVKSTPRINF